MPEPLYVSPIKNRPVSRYGTATPSTTNQIIGGKRLTLVFDPKGEDELAPQHGNVPPNRPFQIDESVVERIPAHEAYLFRREYARHIADGDLKERTREDYEAYIKKLHESGGQAEIDAKAKASAEAKAAP